MLQTKRLSHTAALRSGRVLTCVDNVGTTTLRDYTLCGELGNLDSLTDVASVPAPNDNDFLTVNSNVFEADATLADQSLEGLLDVTFSAPAGDEVSSKLMYDGNEWVDVPYLQRIVGVTGPTTIDIDFGTRNVFLGACNAVTVRLPNPSETNKVLVGEIFHIYLDESSSVNISVDTLGANNFTNLAGDSVTSLIVTPSRRFVKVILSKSADNAGAYVQLME